MAALPPLVTVVDLGDWLGQSLAVDDARAGAVIRAASTLVRRETGRQWVTEVDEDDAYTLDESVPAITENDLEVAQTVVKKVAARLWWNPAGASSQTTGPFGASWSEAGLVLTDDEKEMLAGYATSSRPKLWTLPTTRGDCLETTYIDVEPPGAPLPYLAGDVGY